MAVAPLTRLTVPDDVAVIAPPGTVMVAALAELAAAIATTSAAAQANNRRNLVIMSLESLVADVALRRAEIVAFPLSSMA